MMMTEGDKRAFFELIKSVFPIFDKPVPAPPVLKFWWAALERYPMQAVQAGFNQHIATAKFAPKPAEIISVIIAHDGRPEAEEAWGIAVRAHDESATVVWTREIQEAWGIAQPIFSLGDKVGARMAFRERYNVLISDARSAMVPVSWSASVGHNPELRKDVLERAIEKGQLALSCANHHIAALEAQTPAGAAVAGLLTGSSTTPPESVREKIEAIRSVISAAKFESKKSMMAMKRISDDARDKNNFEDYFASIENKSGLSAARAL